MVSIAGPGGGKVQKMKTKYSNDFKAQILKEVKQVHNVAMVARKHNISSKNIYNWVKAEALASKTPMFDEVKGLKKELSETKLELEILKDLLKKTYRA